MPSSGSGRLISGSWTVASAALTASSAGDPVSVSDMRGVSPSTGDPSHVRARTCSDPARGRPSLYGGPAGGPPELGVTHGNPQAGTRGPGGARAARPATPRDPTRLGVAVRLFRAAL